MAPEAIRRIHAPPAFLALAPLLLLAMQAHAQNVRGQVTFPDGTPAAGIGVRACSNPTSCTGPSVSGPDGMYYLYSVAPPGRYSLQLFKSSPDAPIASYDIYVLAQEWTDIPPLKVL